MYIRCREGKMKFFTVCGLGVCLFAANANAQLYPASMSGSGGQSSSDTNLLAHSDDRYIRFDLGQENDLACYTITATFEAYAPGNDYDQISFNCESAVEADAAPYDPVLCERIQMYSWTLNRWYTVAVSEEVNLGQDQMMTGVARARGFIHPLTAQVLARVVWESDSLFINDARVDTAFWTFEGR